MSAGKPSGLGPCPCCFSWGSTCTHPPPPAHPEPESTFRWVGEGLATFLLAPTQAQPALASVVKIGLSGLLPRPFLESGPEGHLAKTNYGCRVECGRVAAEQAQTWQACQWWPLRGFHNTGPYGVPRVETGQERVPRDCQISLCFLLSEVETFPLLLSLENQKSIIKADRIPPNPLPLGSSSVAEGGEEGLQRGMCACVCARVEGGCQSRRKHPSKASSSLNSPV